MVYTYNQDKIDEIIEFRIPSEAKYVDSYEWNRHIAYVYKLPDYSSVTAIKSGGKTKTIISTTELKKVKSEYIDNMTYLVSIKYDIDPDSESKAS